MSVVANGYFLCVMIWRDPTMIPYIILAMLPALTFHEWGHAMMAKLRGDDTAEREGRLTLNPMAHLDVMGVVFLLMIGFGWAKPVPVNPANLKGKWAEFFVSLAGPAMNIFLALVFILIAWSGIIDKLPPEQASMIGQLVVISIYMNFALALFNMIPIGPLDGQKVLSQLLPLRTAFAFDNWNARYGSMILFGLILFESFAKVGPFRLLVQGPASWLTGSFTGMF